MQYLNEKAGRMQYSTSHRGNRIMLTHSPQLKLISVISLVLMFLDRGSLINYLPKFNFKLKFESKHLDESEIYVVIRCHIFA